MTVNSQVALANRLTNLVIDPATSDIVGFIDGGCALVRADIDTDEDVRKNVGFLFQNEERIISGGRP